MTPTELEELERLRHDIDRLQQANTELATEIANLREASRELVEALKLTKSVLGGYCDVKNDCEQCEAYAAIEKALARAGVENEH